MTQHSNAAAPDRSDAYDHAAASLAWERTLAFIRSGTR